MSYVAKNPKNQSLVDEFVMRLEREKHVISKRLVWESLIKQAVNSEKVI